MTTKLTQFEGDVIRDLGQKVPPDDSGFNHIKHETLKTLIRHILQQQREMIRKEVEKLEGKPIHYLDILSLLSDKE